MQKRLIAGIILAAMVISSESTMAFAFNGKMEKPYRQLINESEGDKERKEAKENEEEKEREETKGNIGESDFEKNSDLYGEFLGDIILTENVTRDGTDKDDAYKYNTNKDGTDNDDAYKDGTKKDDAHKNNTNRDDINNGINSPDNPGKEDKNEYDSADEPEDSIEHLEEKTTLTENDEADGADEEDKENCGAKTDACEEADAENKEDVEDEENSEDKVDGEDESEFIQAYDETQTDYLDESRIAYVSARCAVYESKDMKKNIATLLPGSKVAILNYIKISGNKQLAYILFEYGDKVLTGYVDKMIVPEDQLANTIMDWNSTISSFPASYRDALNELHAKYPNWQFQVFNTGLSWQDVVSNEMYPTRNLIPSYFPVEMLDMSDANYNRASGTFRVWSDPNWVQASREAVEYYLDPRNFINPQGVFQFERIAYNGSYQTEVAVESVIAGTFMSHANLKGTNLTYAQAFVKIAKELNLNPMNLAARVRQEQGVKGDSALISGNVADYKGYYNYFNIEAYGETRDDIISNGMKEAKTNGWNSRYKALYGGSKKVAANYIFAGQDTLYLQKFDVDNTVNGLYWHQYMQNLLGADNESKTVFNTYTNLGIMNSASFIFKIPVYNNMPERAVPHPTDGTKYIKEFVTNTYKSLLKRNPDKGGYDFWVNELTSGRKSVGQFVYDMVKSAEFKKKGYGNEAFVTLIYQTLTEKTPGKATINSLTEELKQGLSREKLLYTVLTGKDCSAYLEKCKLKLGSVSISAAESNTNVRKFIARCYLEIHGRPYDMDGLDFWADQVVSKKLLLKDLGYYFISSNEFQKKNTSDTQYLNVLYKTLFNRNPDSGGHSFWKNELSKGRSRKEVYDCFTASPEFTKVLRSYGL